MQGRPFASEWFFKAHATDPLVFTLTVPSDFVLTRVEVTQIASTLAGFAAVVYVQPPAELVGYANNGETLDLTEATALALLSTITVAGSAAKGALDCSIPIQSRSIDGTLVTEDPSSFQVKVTVTTPGTAKVIGVRFYGILGSQ